MNIVYDKIADALYWSFRKGKIHKTIRVKDTLLADVDKKGNLIGIEMLNASAGQTEKSFAQIIKKGIPVKINPGTFVHV